MESEIFIKRCTLKKKRWYHDALLHMCWSAFLSFAIARHARHNPVKLITLPYYGFHVHHFVVGFFIMFVVGVCLFYISENCFKTRVILASIFGGGMGMFFDEQDMWFWLKNEDPEKNVAGLKVLFIMFSIIFVFRGTYWLYKYFKNRIDKDDLPGWIAG